MQTIEARRGPKLGLWIDDPPRVVLTDGYFATLESLGVQVLAVMVDRSVRGWNPTWSVAQLEELGERCTRAGIELVITVWPDPVPGYLAAMEDGIAGILEVVRVDAIEVDTEHNWKVRRVRGFPRARIDGVWRSPLDLAGDDLVDRLRRLKRAYRACRLELTTFTSHTENGRSADVAPYMDRLVVQAYSKRHRGRGEARRTIGWDHTYGPGHMQHHTLDRTLLVPGIEDGRPEIAIGLAAWDQRGFPERAPHDAMRAAYDAAVARDVVEVRYWSSKWVLGVRSNGYALEFLRELAAERLAA